MGSPRTGLGSIVIPFTENLLQSKANPCTSGNSASIIIVHRPGGLEAVPRQVGLGEVSWDESSRQVRGWGRQAGVEKRSWKRLPGRESSR